MRLKTSSWKREIFKVLSREGSLSFKKVLFLVLFGVISSFTWFFPLLQRMVFQGYDFFLFFGVFFLSFCFASYFLEFFWGVGGYPKIDRHRWLGDYFLLRELGVCVRRVQILVISF
jgi:hypothetical protein